MSTWMRAVSAAMIVACFGTSDVSAGTLNLDDADQIDFADGLLNEGDQAISGPLTVTFRNIVTSDGEPGAQIDEDGIYFGRDSFDFAVVSVDLFFNVEVVLTAYDVDFFFLDELEPEEATFQLTAPNGDATGANDFFPEGDNPRTPFDMGAIAFFEPGVAYTLTHTVQGFDVSQIDEFDFNVVPVPASALLLLSALIGGGLIARRRRT